MILADGNDEVEVGFVFECPFSLKSCAVIGLAVCDQTKKWNEDKIVDDIDRIRWVSDGLLGLSCQEFCVRLFDG